MASSLPACRALSARPLFRMIFGRIDLTDEAACLDAVLAHTVRLDGRAVQKGARLDGPTIGALRAAGIERVTAARFEPGDVPEDDAAAALGAALATDGLQAGRPAGGRVNLIAGPHGFFRAEAGLVDALNGVDEALTLATLPDATPVQAGAKVATIKIIPFAVPCASLNRALALARLRPPVRLRAFRPRLAGLVATQVRGLKESLVARAIEVTSRRVQALGGVMLSPRVTAHEMGSVAAALTALLAEGAELLLIAGASATVDRADEVPAGICAAGGVIEHFGMPVDPGNLLCFGRIGTVPALVLPGCARSPALNGIDFCLARLFADDDLSSACIAGMGVGGLLKDFPDRPGQR
jgi:molybdenum cofactor cytidylyltransferase